MISKREKDAKLQELIEEENNLALIKRVFGNQDGFEVLNWIISDICNFWVRAITPAELGKYEVGRTLFNRVIIADPALAFKILEARKNLAESIRQRELEELK
jgi:hypothetical protein